jgi:hypothetical protein
MFACICLKSQSNDELYSATSIGAITPALTTLARADVALSRSFITPTAYRGNLGESVVGNCFLKNTLSQSGSWQALTPRSGPQGLDHLFMKFNKAGSPTALLVGESKFGTSQLGNTADGIQMGKNWISKRLYILGSRYIAMSNAQILPSQDTILTPNKQLNVILRNGKTVSFWRSSSLSTWNFTGSKSELPEAQRLSNSYGSYLRNAADGKITYRSRLFNIIKEGNSLKIFVRDAKDMDIYKSASQLRMIWKEPILLKGVLNKPMPNDLRLEIARTLKSKMPQMSDRECLHLARDVSNKYTVEQLTVKGSPLWMNITQNSLAAGGIGCTLDIAIQVLTTGQVDFKRTALSGSSVAGGALTGQLTQMALMNTGVGQSAIKSLSGSLNCSSTALTSSLSMLSGGIFASALFSYGGYFLGYNDLQSANRQMAAGTLGTGAGLLFSAGVTGAVAMWGTAGTGTAISTLGGAAATNASLAWLGGGTLAAGGLGTAGGFLILSGGTAVAAIVVVYGVQLYFDWSDRKDDNNRVQELLSRYSDHSTMEKIVNNHMATATNQ